jgi:4-amino-4-deoxy-L-arabinose transferase-like glycosyltransferase
MKPDAARTAPNPGEVSPRQILALVLGYFAVQILMRVWLFHNVQVDEAEQVIMTQEWHWGYTMQPPLYTWIQIGFFHVFGLNVFALILLKSIFLCGTFLFTFAVAREMTGSDRAGLAASTSLFLLPQIAWESQRDQSHSVLATMLATALLFVFLRLVKTRRPATYLLFGLCTALGCLGKYNFAVFVVALLAAAVSVRNLRPAVLHRGMLLAVLVFLPVIAPHVRWMTNHHAELMARANEIHEHAASRWGAYALGFESLSTAVLGFSGLAAAVFAVLFFRAPVIAAETPGAEDFRRLTRRVVLIGLVVCVGMIFGFQAHFKDRWMQPLLFATPVFLVMEVYRRLDGVRLKRLLWFNGFAAAAIFVILNGTPAFALATGQYRYLEPDYSNMAAQLEARGFTNGVIAAESRRISGNLRFRLPQCVGLCTEIPPMAARRDVPWLAIWNAPIDSEIPPVERETNLLWKCRGVDLTREKPALLQVPYEYTRIPAVRYAYVLFPPDTGTSTNTPADR